MNLAQYRKFIVTLVGLASSAVAQGLIDGSAAKWVAVVIAALTTLGVYQTPNEPEPSDGGYTDAVTLLVVVVIIVILLRVLGII